MGDHPPIRVDPDSPVAPWIADIRGLAPCEYCGNPAIYLWKHPRCAYFVRACTRDHAIAAVARDAWWIKLVTAYRRQLDELGSVGAAADPLSSPA
jgi:hypothetical protein